MQLIHTLDYPLFLKRINIIRVKPKKKVRKMICLQHKINLTKYFKIHRASHKASTSN